MRNFIGFWVLWMVFMGTVEIGQTFGAGPGQPVFFQTSREDSQAVSETTQPLAIAGLAPRHRVELFQAFGKRPVLLVSYPWKEYARASIEVRFFSQTEVDDERIQPLFFRAQYWKGKMIHEAYECLLQAGDTPIYKMFTFEGQDWRLVADRTTLGRPAVCVVREIPAEARLRTQSALAVVYPLLDGWVQEDGHLCLDLPGQYYPQPGQLRVWFLRGNRVLWTEKLAWPGIKRQ